MKDEPKKLYRSRKDKLVAGVCGGIGEHFKIDPVWIRLVFVLLLFANGIGLLIYLVLWILVPQNPVQKDGKQTVAEETVERVASRFNKKKEKDDTGTAAVLVGALLVILGIAFLMQYLFRWFSFNYVWPLIIIAIGIYILRRRE